MCAERIIFGGNFLLAASSKRDSRDVQRLETQEVADFSL